MRKTPSRVVALRGTRKTRPVALGSEWMRCGATQPSSARVGVEGAQARAAAIPAAAGHERPVAEARAVAEGGAVGVVVVAHAEEVAELVAGDADARDELRAVEVAQRRDGGVAGGAHAVEGDGVDRAGVRPDVVLLPVAGGGVPARVDDGEHVDPAVAVAVDAPEVEARGLQRDQRVARQAAAVVGAAAVAVGVARLDVGGAPRR
ncbi:MAG: hypothetical protein U1F43_34725 [Myxococcota bacterium]